MSGGRGMHYSKYQSAHMGTNERVVGIGSKPPAPVPRNILVKPLKSPPMELIKDAEAPTVEDEEIRRGTAR